MIKLIKQSLLIVSCFTFSLAFAQELSITNSLPASASAGQPFEAKYSLTKSPSMGSFAKFQLDLPAGFTAETVEIKGGNFTFENNRVKIVWVSLPPDATFSFSFKIGAAASASGNITLAPQFFYLENNVKKEYTVPASSVSFGGAGATDNTASTSTPSATDNTASTSATENTASNTTTTPPPAENTTPPAVTETPAKAEPVKVAEPVKTEAPAKTNEVAANRSTPPPAAAKSGVVYHVQLAALTGKPTKSRFAEYGTVKVVEDAGLFKVLVGNFKTLDEARAYKKTLLSKGAEGVFVVAYENGVRVKIN